MPRRMKDLLAQRALENFVGRTNEMATLLQCLEDDCPIGAYPWYRRSGEICAGASVFSSCAGAGC